MSSNSESDSEEDSDDDFLVFFAAYLLSKKRSKPRKPRVDNSALPENPKTESMWARIRATGSDELLVTLLSTHRRAFWCRQSRGGVGCDRLRSSAMGFMRCRRNA